MRPTTLIAPIYNAFPRWSIVAAVATGVPPPVVFGEQCCHHRRFNPHPALPAQPAEAIAIAGALASVAIRNSPYFDAKVRANFGLKPR
jgi:hypothetical protein